MIFQHRFKRSPDEGVEKSPLFFVQTEFREKPLRDDFGGFHEDAPVAEAPEERPAEVRETPISEPISEPELVEAISVDEEPVPAPEPGLVGAEVAAAEETEPAAVSESAVEEVPAEVDDLVIFERLKAWLDGVTSRHDG